ncbi:RNA polymerase sigma factor RpoE [Aquisphaera giovannonii]|uniref:RNA polymerase sigma factor RpoE n=1 Tax=Aquisphaera giovannonii TaxID=406548 RepID=A0A5B9WGV7_9BACT|nr:sigma-70 family RNA polymerase sigma factor [Aquisphaera giovannonii]QEH39080.1 RNA polymerase sigma factor RpoE [Aquisphaera giovannonii]
MNDPRQMRTSASLLGRLRLDHSDPGDWAEFVRRYGPLIRTWCRRWGLQEADADDLAQDVLARLAARMRSFEYDPSKSFRAYVKTLAHFTWCDLIESRKRPGGGSGDSDVHDRLAAVEARDDLQARLADAFDQEVLEEATARVRLRVEPRTWEAFRLTAVEGLSGADAAAKVGMEVATVFKAKSKVQKMLREEIRRIEEG